MRKNVPTETILKKSLLTVDSTTTRDRKYLVELENISYIIAHLCLNTAITISLVRDLSASVYLCKEVSKSANTTQVHTANISGGQFTLIKVDR